MTGQAQTINIDFKDSLMILKPTENNKTPYTRYEVKVEVPDVEGAAADSTRAWICNLIADYSYTDSLARERDIKEGDYVAIIKKAAQHFYESQRSVAGDIEDISDFSYPWYHEFSIEVTANEKDFVTLTYYSDDYYGGVHGTYANGGATFRKSDGSRLTWENMFTSKKDVRPYMSEALDRLGEDEEFDWVCVFESTNSNRNTYPMPKTTPWVDGNYQVCFVYQPYEIGPFAMGNTEVEIPAYKLKNVLKEDVRKMIARPGLEADGRGSDEFMLTIYVDDPNGPTNVRNSPNGKVVGKLKNSDMISVDYCRNGWLHIAEPRWYDGENGGLISKTSKELWIHNSVVGIGWERDGAVDFELRREPMQSGRIVYKGRGDKCPIERILDITDGWVKIRIKGGKTGWVEAALLCGNTLTVCGC